jgi:hypothetical protein
MISLLHRGAKNFTTPLIIAKKLIAKRLTEVGYNVVDAFHAD